MIFVGAVFGYFIALLSGVSAFFFTLSILPSKSLFSEQLEELKARDPFKRDDERLSLMEHVVTGERRAALVRRLAEAGWYTTTPAKFGLRIIAGACFGAVIALVAWKYLGLRPGLLFPMVIGLGFLGGYSPFFAMNRASESRKSAIQKALDRKSVV